MLKTQILEVGGRVLATHGDGTFTVKYANGETEEDVPKACIRVETGRERRKDHGSK